MQRFEARLEFSEGEEREYNEGVDALCTKKGFSAARLLRDAMQFQDDDEEATQSAEEGCKYHVHPGVERCKKERKRAKNRDGGSRKRRKTTH